MSTAHGVATTCGPYLCIVELIRIPSHFRSHDPCCLLMGLFLRRLLSFFPFFYLFADTICTHKRLIAHSSRGCVTRCSWLHEAVSRTVWDVRLRLGSTHGSHDPIRGKGGGKQKQ